MHNCCGIADSRSIYVQAEKPGISGNKEYKTQNGLGLLECSERVEKLFEDSSLKEFIENNQ